MSKMGSFSSNILAGKGVGFSEILATDYTDLNINELPSPPAALGKRAHGISRNGLHGYNIPITDSAYAGP